MRLSTSTLGRLPGRIDVPRYDRAALETGIVHLGIGAFHRAHQAVMTDDVLATGDRRWGIVAASLRSPETRDALAPQDGLYTVAIRGAEGERLRVVGAVGKVLVAPEDPRGLIAVLSQPSVRIVTLTITEKGYCLDPATRRLDASHPDIVHDLSGSEEPRSALGIILSAIEMRRREGTQPFAVVPCDNLPSNGRTVQGLLEDLASRRDPALARFVRDGVPCPSTMVDRIVPATTDDDRRSISEALGVEDAWPVVTEPFTQWVIEDAFPAGRPDWTISGAQFVSDVAPFELMKLRLLNGAHSSLAYLGLPLGHETVAQAASDPRLASFLDGLWAELIPTVPPPPGADLRAYCGQLLTRFRNPAIRHRLAQIAMDGSQKLPQRLLASWRDIRRGGRNCPHVALAIAAFVAHASGTGRDGRPTAVSDPLAAELARAAAGWREAPAAAIERFLGLRTVVAPDLACDSAVQAALTLALEAIAERGVAAALHGLRSG